MTSSEKLFPPLWTAVEVRCCQSKIFVGYICGASDSEQRTIVLCSVPEGKITFVSGWSIEKIEILSNYPPLPEEMKAKLDSIYSSAIDDEPVYSTDCDRTDSLDRRRTSVLNLFGPLVARTSEDNEKIVLYDGLVTVMPPYLPSSCRSSNPTLLKRVQEMLMQIDERSL
nr:SLC10 [Hymenolepis microstoma]